MAVAGKSGIENTAYPAKVSIESAFVNRLMEHHKMNLLKKYRKFHPYKKWCTRCKIQFGYFSPFAL